VSITIDEVSTDTCRLEIAEITDEREPRQRLRRWTVHLPGDGFQLEVHDPGDSVLMSPPQRFARTLAHQLGHDDVDL
jgi:hypothetical protein